MKHRDEYIDILKGIGIILVIWGHTSSFLFNEIYAFHMPLFFLLSGCFFSTHLPFKDFLKKKVNHLIIPFIIFFLLSCLYYWGILAVTGRFTTNSLYSLKNIFPYNNELINTPLWFFYALFWMSLIYYLLRKYVKNELVICLICIILHITEFFLSSNDIAMPAYLGRTFREIIYMHIGYLLYNKSKFITNIHRATSRNITNTGNAVYERGTDRSCNQIGGASLRISIKNIILSIICIIVFAGLFAIQNRMHTKSIEYSLFTILTALSGICIILYLGAIICNIQNALKAISTYLGRHTLCLFALHLPLFEISRPIAKKIFAVDSLAYDIVSFIIVLTLSVFAGEILMMIFPKYLGNSSFAKAAQRK